MKMLRAMAECLYADLAAAATEAAKFGVDRSTVTHICRVTKSVFPSFGRFLLLALFMGMIGGYDHRRPRSRHVMAGH
jgi:hypothetical protein